MKNTTQQWAVSLFAISGAFILCGIGGAGIAHLLGQWETPLAGFSAAFGVVSMAYLSAPGWNKRFAIAVFFLGAVCAWFFIGSSWYPEPHLEKGHHHTYLPYIVTLAGGLVPLAVIFLPRNHNEIDRIDNP
ncbi:MAG: hypothetical protein P8171_13985 [Candidatus Thiodiazotropha sp.]